MTLPLLTAVAPRWEVDLAAALSRSDHVHVARRCADVPELLGVAAAGLGRVAVVSCDLRGVDRALHAESAYDYGLGTAYGDEPQDAERHRGEAQPVR